ncbi:hypothetical protein GPL15_20335 [Clostridium sp. MCC353]|uniref:hypothetical protein n=1 Tax=Clostridium sp. MCC353 TaxID=2592646 RepID=UPI001C0321D6|nr:hypothetical protein [Clostridium sp. MCC353]MBT9778831.1 hypothetical protein [Clostridium sp. MCC353]
MINISLYKGRKKVAGNTSNEKIRSDLANYTVTFNDSVIEEIELFDTIQNLITSNSKLSSLISLFKNGLSFLNNKIKLLNDALEYTANTLNQRLDNKANISHTHDERYYTEQEIDSFLLYKIDSASSGIPYYGTVTNPSITNSWTNSAYIDLPPGVYSIHAQINIAGTNNRVTLKLLKGSEELGRQSVTAADSNIYSASLDMVVMATIAERFYIHTWGAIAFNANHILLSARKLS